MVTICFLCNDGTHAKGDYVELPEAHAEGYLKRGVAEEAEPVRRAQRGRKDKQTAQVRR